MRPYNPLMPRPLLFPLAAAALFALEAVATRAQSGPLTVASTNSLRSPGYSIATNSPNGQPLSTRVVAYTLDAKIDTDQKSLDGTEALTYKNLTGQPLTRFPFHLYLNAFRPESTFTSETHFGGGIRDNETEDDYPKEKVGGITITQITADNVGDLTGQMHYIAPDDGNAQDHTVAELALPQPLAPGDSITFRIRFHDQFPLSIARNGWKRDFIMGGQWYPKLGVFWHGAWNCHQYHSTTEFFSDFATFNVHLTLPRRYVVGASGVPTGEIQNGDGTKTLSFYGEDIGDFAWAASPHFYVTDGTYVGSMGPVKVHVLALAAHPDAGPRYLKVTTQTLQKFNDWYGPYPYKIITVIDPEPGSEIGGMEYPTLFTGGTSWFEPTHLTEVVTEHEFGHQYWYGMVATNEFEDAWLDEGINSYTEVNVLGSLLGPKTSGFDFRWANLGDASNERLEYLSAPDLDPVTRWAFKFRNSSSYGGVTYGKSATLLATLEGIVGPDTMREAMHTYFMRYRFTHPTTEDFLRTIEEVAIARGRATGTFTPTTPSSGAPTLYLPAANGTAAPAGTLPNLTSSLGAAPTTLVPTGSSLRPYFNQAVYGTAVLDYAVDSVSSDRVQWWLPEPKDTKNTQYRDTVVLRRRGEFLLPVTVEVVFEDGSRVREHWDGVDRWTRFTYIRNSKIRSAEVDPDHTVLLDRDLFNNSYTTDENHVPAHKVANLWLDAQQLLFQLTSWLV